MITANMRDKDTVSVTVKIGELAKAIAKGHKIDCKSYASHCESPYWYSNIVTNIAAMDTKAAKIATKPRTTEPIAPKARASARFRKVARAKRIT